MEQNARILVVGDRTLAGASLRRELKRQGYNNIHPAEEENPDWTAPQNVVEIFNSAAPEYVFLTAGKSGGIAANQRLPADLMLDNLLIETLVIPAAYHARVKKLFYLASSCCYPRECPQPMRVESLLAGPLEPTNEAYAVAKIAGIKLCEALRRQYRAPFISGIPANPFGPGDDFSLEDSHVIPALLRRFHEAKINRADSVILWGTGTPRREFIYSDDLAQACIFVMQNYDGLAPINLGSGASLSIGELAAAVKDVVGYAGNIKYDSKKPDGMPEKALDSGELFRLGWRPATPLKTALEKTYAWWREQSGNSE